MPKRSDYIADVAPPNETYDGDYLPGHDFDPVATYYGTPRTLAADEVVYNLQGKRVKADSD